MVTETTAGRSYHKTYSSDGTVSSAQDPGGTIYYTYYPDGKVKTITAPGTIITQMEYDIAGNQTRLIDPSAGTINYAYNGFGELLTQQNARLQTTTNTYYSDGRIERKVTPDGTTKYRYNSNKLLSNVNSYGTVSHTYAYDTKGRVTSVTDTIPGTTPLITSYTYDALGRSSTITHPSGLVETNNYNSFGYLFRIDAAGSAVWTTSSMNARGQITAGQYGTNLAAGYGYDSFGFQTSITAGANNSTQNFTYGFNATTGNLSWRQNNNGTDLKETFNYDNLDRLDNVYKGISSPTMTLDMAYDPNKGGITTKTDVGTLMYSISGKPYAVSNINPVTSVVPVTLDSLTYTSFESVSTIEEGAYFASFVYNPEDQRAKMEVKQNGSVILTRWYLGSNYIKETSSGVTREYTFIGGNAYTAPVVSIKQNGVPTTYYLLRDHLGSITHVVNASTGSTTYEYSYDAWGRMRNTANWTNYSPGSEPVLFIAGRGFTGHEHLSWFNLINMNGRVYDPLTGQFLNVDNNVQSPDFTQNFNRYAYCLNNPLKYKDPDGEWVITALTMLANMYVSTSAVNGWQFNPVKWDWRNAKTWVSLGQSAVAGYTIGSKVGTFVKRKALEAYYSEIIPHSDNLSQEFTASTDKYQNQYGNPAVTLEKFRTRFSGMTYDEIMTGSTRTFGIKHYSKLIDPKYSFVNVNINGTVQEIDMVHFMVVGKLGQGAGFIKEATQLIDGLLGDKTAMKSAFFRQDLYSNALGSKFFYFYNYGLRKFAKNLTNYLFEYFDYGIYNLPIIW